MRGGNEGGRGQRGGGRRDDAGDVHSENPFWCMRPARYGGIRRCSVGHVSSAPVPGRGCVEAPGAAQRLLGRGLEVLLVGHLQRDHAPDREQRGQRDQPAVGRAGRVLDEADEVRADEAADVADRVDQRDARRGRGAAQQRGGIVQKTRWTPSRKKRPMASAPIAATGPMTVLATNAAAATARRDGRRRPCARPCGRCSAG